MKKTHQQPGRRKTSTSVTDKRGRTKIYFTHKQDTSFRYGTFFLSSYFPLRSLLFFLSCFYYFCWLHSCPWRGYKWFHLTYYSCYYYYYTSILSTNCFHVTAKYISSTHQHFLLKKIKTHVGFFMLWILMCVCGFHITFAFVLFFYMFYYNSEFGSQEQREEEWAYKKEGDLKQSLLVQGTEENVRRNSFFLNIKL